MSDANLLVEPLPDGWQNCRFDDVCDRVKDSYIPVEGGDTPYIGLEHLAQGFPAFVGCGTESDIKSSKTAFKSGDVLFGKLRPYLRKGAHADFDGISSTDMLVFRAEDATDPVFLKYLVHHDSFIDHAKSTTTGVQHPRTSWPSLSKFELSLPPLPEQKKIAHVLSTVQRAIEAQEKIIRTTSELKKALMQKLFTEGLRGEPQKQTEIGPVPESWEVVPLGAYATFKNGVNFSKEQKGEKGILTVDVKNMYGRDNEVAMDGLYRVNKEFADNYKLVPGDVLFVRSSLKLEGVGWASLFSGYAEPATYCGFIIRARLNDADQFNPGFLTYFFRSDSARSAIVSGGAKVGITNINQGILKSLCVPKPPTDQQLEINAVLQVIDEKVDCHMRKKDSYSQLFRTLLHELMTARRRVGQLSI